MSRNIFLVAGVFNAPSLLLVDSAVKGTAILMLAAALCVVLRRDSAATRHLVWLLAIVALLAVPVLSAMLPEWRVLPRWGASIPPAAALAATSPPSIARPAVGAFEVPQNPEPDDVDSQSGSVSPPVAAGPDSRPALVTPEATGTSASGSWNWRNALPLVWAIGFCVLILRLMAARWMLWNTERQGTVNCSSMQPSKATHDTLVTVLDAASLQLGICRPVTLLIHPGSTIPVVWGILRCRLLLPAAARHWSGEQLRSVLLHELAHIKRRDTLAQLLAQIACALHWFNPLVWFTAWRLGVERERACDDLVLASGVRPSAYAEHLLEVVTGLSPARWTHSCGLAMARKSSLEGRLVAVLGENLNRRGVSAALAAIALTIAVGIAVPIAMLRAADEQPRAADERPSAAVPQKPVQQQEVKPDAQANDESQQPKEGAKLPGRLFVNAGLHTTKDATRFSQSAIAIDPNTGTWTRLQNLSESGITVPLSPVRVSPDGRTMLFMREKEIWKCDAITGENPARVFQKGQPKAWAPDGKEFIAVVENAAGKPGSTENWRVSADGEKQSLLSLPIGEVVEDWSADGRWLLGWSHADRQLYIMQPDGSGRRRLTNTNRNASRNEHPRFSPDARRMVYLQTLYQGTDDAPDSRFSLRTINLDGTDDREMLGETAVVPAPAKATWTAPMGARWSPDGKHLAVVLFDHDRSGGIMAINGNWRLAIIEANGGNLRELKLEGVLRTVLQGDGPEWRPTAPAVVTREPRQGAKLQPGTEEKLQWGEPASGLRMALAWPPTLGEPAAGEVPDLFLAVQNVSAAPVRLCTTAEAPNQRRLTFATNGVVQFRIVSQEANGANVTLQPREVVFLRLFTEDADNKERASRGSTIASTVRQSPAATVRAEMEIAKAPAGAWTGKLVTPETRAGVGAEAPKNRKAQELFKVWLGHARVNGKIPGVCITRLGDRVKEFVRANTGDKSGDPYAKRMEPLVSRLDGARDWQPAEASALLNDIAAVSDVPLSVLLEDTAGGTIQYGPPLNKKLENAPWGEALPNGLRVACLLEPRAAVHRLGTPLTMRILVHNAGQEPVVFRSRSWHHIEPTARNAKGAEIEMESVTRYTRSPLVAYRLVPGGFVELASPGIGIGRYGFHDFKAADIASWISAKEGDDVTLTPGPVPLGDWNEASVLNSQPRWWLDFLTARLNLATPLPADAAERAELLRRTVRDVFHTDPTAGEIAAFVADREANALESLAKRLAQRAGLTPFTGSLTSGTTKFRVLPADPGGAKPADKPAATPSPPAVPAPAEKPKTSDAGKQGADGEKQMPSVDGMPVRVKLADNVYTKSGIPVGDLGEPMTNWRGGQDGLCLGLRVAEDAQWRIGGEVKVELWVCNPGGKDVKFQWCDRRDTGLRMKMKGADGKEYDSGPCLKIIGQRFILCALLPAGHIMKVKEFSVKLLPPQKAGDAWFVDGPRFMLPAGDYKFRCELDLPGCSVTRADGQQVTPANGEWTGTLKSGEVDLRIAPATDTAN